MFVDRCIFSCPFSFGHCIVCPLIYGFWLPLLYLQTLLEKFTVRRKHWTLLVTFTVQFPIKFNKNLFDVFMIYHIVIIDMLDFNNTTWRLIQTRTFSYHMLLVDLTANISQWENVLCDNCIRILKLMHFKFIRL